MALSARNWFLLALGVVMVALGVYVALRPLMYAGQPITASRWLDMAFAAFFILRGAMNVRSARRRASPVQGRERSGR